MEKEKQLVAKRPICPDCGCNTLVLFAPPKQGMYCDGNWDKVDLDRTHLYCCNGETDCKTIFYLNELTTPLNGLKVNFLKK